MPPHGGSVRVLGADAAAACVLLFSFPLFGCSASFNAPNLGSTLPIEDELTGTGTGSGATSGGDSGGTSGTDSGGGTGGSTTGDATADPGGRDPDDADASGDAPEFSTLQTDLGAASLPTEVTSTSTDLLRAVGAGVSVDGTSSIESGTNYREASVEISYAADQLSGRLVTLQTTRVNSIENGDFESTAVNASDADTLGGWNYPASYGTILRQSSVTVGSGNTLAVTEANSSNLNNFYVQQSFPISPGEIFRISYAVDPGGLLPAFVKDGAYTDGHIEVRFKTTTTAGGAAVAVNIPASQGTVPTGTTLTKTSQNYERLNVLTSASAKRQDHLYVTPECSTHTIYSANSLNYTQNMTFQRKNPGASSCESLVVYGQLVFVFTGGSSDGSTFELDNVVVDWDRQIETEVFDRDSGEVLQRSTLESFRVDPFDADAHPHVGLRVYVRSLDSSKSPVLRAVQVESGNELRLTVNPEPLIEFSKARMGMDIHIAPKSEFNDPTMSMQTECREPYSSTSYLNCYSVFGKYNLARPRIDMPMAGFNFTPNDSDYDTSLTSYGTAYLTRVREANDAGLDPLILLNVAGDTNTLWDDGCALIPARPASGTWASATSQELSRHLVEVYAKAAASNLNGTTDIGAFADQFEIFNEPNLSTFAPACTSQITAAEARVLEDAVAGSLKSHRSDLEISSSGLASNGTVFDYSYMTGTLIPVLTSANFDHMSFHPYTDAYRPERIGEFWSLARESLADFSWSPVDKPVHVGEFGFSMAGYDPGCANGGAYQWGRGWGDRAHGNRMAIATVEVLATESESVIAWGRMSNESESLAPTNTCWRSLGGYKSLFVRDSGSGYLSTGDHADVTRYSPNSGGSAFMTIGKFLSYGSPTPTPSASPIALATSSSRDEDTSRYHAEFYRTDFGYAVALWFYRDFEFGVIDASVEEQTDIYYQNFLYGARGHDGTMSSYGDPNQDYGYEGRRVHDVVLVPEAGASFEGIQGTGRIAGKSTKGVTVVDLETGVETQVAATFIGGELRIRDVSIGERPTLILIRTHGSVDRPYENLSYWADPDPSAYNSWFRVNKDAATAPPAEIPTSGNTFVQGRKSPMLTGGVYPSGASNPYFNYRSPSSTSPEGNSEYEIPTYNACPGHPEADYGICIQP